MWIISFDVWKCSSDGIVKLIHGHYAFGFPVSWKSIATQELPIMQYGPSRSIGEQLCPLLRCEQRNGIFHDLSVVHWAVTRETNHACYINNTRYKFLYCTALNNREIHGVFRTYCAHFKTYTIAYLYCKFIYYIYEVCQLWNLSIFLPSENVMCMFI